MTASNNFTGDDPSDGFIHYVNQQGSVEQKLTFASANSVILPLIQLMRMPVRAVIRSKSPENRHSIQACSYSTFFTHKTAVGLGKQKKKSTRGYWCEDVRRPAIWTADPSSWPKTGGIDVLEAVNSATTGNQTTLHTSNGCTVHAKRKELGKVLTRDCYNGTDSNAGCGVQGPDDTFGEALNNNCGGSMQ